jgi:predicted amidohydrolase YtcJ
MSAKLILYNGRIHTVDAANPAATAVAIEDGKFTAVGDDAAIMQLADEATTRIDLQGKRAIPGLNDSHIHLIRGGLNYNLELRWDGVPSLADAMRLLAAQVARTPTPQWVRVVGGWTEQQFAEKRMPTIEELNAVAPDTPVFILHLYDRALLNRAALKAVGYTRDTPAPPGGQIVKDARGEPTGLMLATPNAMILYSTLAKGPKLSYEYQVNSSRHFMRELNRFGLTSVIDAGGGFQNFPDDYQVINELNEKKQLTVRIAYNLFTQRPKQEFEDFDAWTKSVKLYQGDDMYRHNGAGEMLVFSAADFEDFLQVRPDLPDNMEAELERVVRLLVENRWPFRLQCQ